MKIWIYDLLLEAENGKVFLQKCIHNWTAVSFLKYNYFYWTIYKRRLSRWSWSTSLQMHFHVSLWKCQADLCPRACRTKWLFSLQEKMCSRRSKHHLVFLLLMALLLRVSSKNLQIVRFTYFNIFRGGKFHDSYICIKSNTSPLKWVQHAKFFVI